jgi:hypothetical protein
MADLPNQIQSSSTRMVTLTTALGSQLPGLSFFLGLAPPGFRAVTLLTGGGTLAIFLLKFSKREPYADCIQKGVRSLTIAILTAIAYGFFFAYVTAGPPAPRSEHVRYQVGFGLAPFSLTPAALRVANEQHLSTKEELMLAFGAYDEDATSRIWKSWSIFVAGAILIGMFVLTYYYWTSGLAWLACIFKSTGGQATKPTQ